MAQFKPTDVVKPIQDGEVSFKVIDWQEKENSQFQNTVVVVLECRDGVGGKKEVKDTFIIDDNPWKLGSFAKAIGEIEQYKTGSMGAEHAVGKTGKCIIHRRKFKLDGQERKVVAVKEYM